MLLLHRANGFVLQRSGDLLIAAVEEGHSLALSEATVDGDPAEVTVLDARTVEVKIPVSASSIRLSFIVDGEAVPSLEIPVSDGE